MRHGVRPWTLEEIVKDMETNGAADEEESSYDSLDRLVPVSCRPLRIHQLATHARIHTHTGTERHARAHAHTQTHTSKGAEVATALP